MQLMLSRDRHSEETVTPISKESEDAKISKIGRKMLLSTHI